MKTIGLTGGIGSGKSYCAQVFQALGFPVYDSDKRAKTIMLNEPIKEQLIQEFGPSTYFENGELNRSFLSSQVFQNSSLLEKLNAIVHPAVQSDRDQWISEQSTSLGIIEAAILIESGAYQSMDYIISVYAPSPIRINRVMKRDSCSQSDVEARISNQLSEADRWKHADFIIHNYKGHSVQSQVTEIIKAIS